MSGLSNSRLRPGIVRMASRKFVFVAICIGAFALLSRVSAQATVQVGYTVVTADTGTQLPVGSALFSYTNAAGVLVSESGVGAATAIRSGRIFVDEQGTQTGIALANP